MSDVANPSDAVELHARNRHAEDGDEPMAQDAAPEPDADEDDEDAGVEAPIPAKAKRGKARKKKDEEPALRLDLTPDHKRMVEALLFAASEPISDEVLAERLPEGLDVAAALDALREDYEGRGVEVVKAASKWSVRTAPDLAVLLERERVEPRKLSRAALETLAVIAYHQPVTRAEIEEIRGVSLSKGTLDLLLEMGWSRMRGRRRAPGRPVTYGTTELFLSHFGLDTLGDLPGVDEMKAAGLLDIRLPPDFGVPAPSSELRAEDEDELNGDEDDDLDALGELELEDEPGADLDDDGDDEEAEDER